MAENRSTLESTKMNASGGHRVARACVFPNHILSCRLMGQRPRLEGRSFSAMFDPSLPSLHRRVIETIYSHRSLSVRH